MTDIPRPYSPFTDSMLSSRSVLRVSNGYCYCTHDKNGYTTYVTKIIMKQKNDENKKSYYIETSCYTKTLLIVNSSFKILEVFGKIYMEKTIYYIQRADNLRTKWPLTLVCFTANILIRYSIKERWP